VAVAAVILVSEWSGISRALYVDAAVIAGAVGVVISVFAFAAGYPLAALALLVAGAIIAQLLARPFRFGWGMGFGVLYAGLPAIALVLIRADAHLGIATILWLLVLVWASDTGGYIFGRWIGGPKLAPRISPKKTWAGFAGGVAVAIVASWAVDHFAIPEASIPIWLAALLSVVSQGGDLGESAFKRRFGAKDSSRLIPGHGGLMDRIDGLISVAVVAALIGFARGGLEAAGSGLLLW
jgi:phosphatidate cytidylyltransferase